MLRRCVRVSRLLTPTQSAITAQIRPMEQRLTTIFQVVLHKLPTVHVMQQAVRYVHQAIQYQTQTLVVQFRPYPVVGK